MQSIQCTLLNAKCSTLIVSCLRWLCNDFIVIVIFSIIRIIDVEIRISHNPIFFNPSSKCDSYDWKWAVKNCTWVFEEIYYQWQNDRRYNAVDSNSKNAFDSTICASVFIEAPIFYCLSFAEPNAISFCLLNTLSWILYVFYCFTNPHCHCFWLICVYRIRQFGLHTRSVFFSGE